MIMKATNREPLTTNGGRRLLVASICVLLLASSGAALAHQGMQRVSGDYELLFESIVAHASHAGADLARVGALQ